MSNNPTARTRSVTEDRFLDGGLVLRQPRHGYRVAIDPIFLAAAVPARDGETILDAGAGTGAAALCLARRVPGARLDGIELQPDLVELARQNAGLNGAAGRVAFHGGDIARPPGEIAPNSYHHVMANPPYHEQGRVAVSPNQGKGLANVESGADLADWVGFCIDRAAPGGSVSFIYGAGRLDALVAELRELAGAIAIFPLWPKAGRPAKRFIVRAIKGGSGPARLLAGLTLHRSDGTYTDEADAILRDGAGLDF